MAAMKPLPADRNALQQENDDWWWMGPFRIFSRNPRVKLLRFVNKSIEIKRSINHVSILLVGPTGVGKTSTINHLLGTNGEIVFAKTNDWGSEAISRTQEFIIYGDDPEYAVKDLALGLIHTPGFGDFDGIRQDTCNIASIKRFFRTHPNLSGCYPNLIFVIAKATDNRIRGESSDLGKSLRYIKELDLVDPNHPNVVAVLTHACKSSTTEENEWSQKMKEIKATVAEVISDALKVTAPVVLLENPNNEGEFEVDLEVCRDYTCLPNGVLQPKNLYDACADVLTKNNDDIGLITLNSIFPAATKCPTKRGHKIETSAKDLERLIREGVDLKVYDDFSCFPSSSVVNVTSKDGVKTQKKMADLGVGEKVMAWDEKRNRTVFTEVIMFAHRGTDAKDVEYLKITLEDGTKITLSANHLVMVGKHKKAVMAQKVKLGDILFTVDGNYQEISPKKVLSIDQVIEQGVYCPITSHGNVIVDNVLASCYASTQDHVFLQGLVKVSAQRLAHLGLMPMRVLHKLRLKRLREIPDGEGIHPYLQWLCKLKLPFVAN